jgi:hypothetical protein
MGIVTRESFPLISLAGFSLAKNACRSALTFTLDVFAQDDAPDPAPASTGLVEEAPVEYSHGKAAAEFGCVPVKVGHHDGPPDAVGDMNWVERVGRWESWWESKREWGDEIDRGGRERVCNEIY